MYIYVCVSVCVCMCVCVCVCVCMCVYTHKHTHTHTLSLSLSLTHTHTHSVELGYAARFLHVSLPHMTCMYPPLHMTHTVSDLATRHVFCFQYGCLVFWGLEPEEQEFFIQVRTP